MMRMSRAFAVLIFMLFGACSTTAPTVPQSPRDLAWTCPGLELDVSAEVYVQATRQKSDAKQKAETNCGNEHKSSETRRQWRDVEDGTATVGRSNDVEENHPDYEVKAGNNTSLSLGKKPRFELGGHTSGTNKKKDCTFCIIDWGGSFGLSIGRK